MYLNEFAEFRRCYINLFYAMLCFANNALKMNVKYHFYQFAKHNLVNFEFTTLTYNANATNAF